MEYEVMAVMCSTEQLSHDDTAGSGPGSSHQSASFEKQQAAASTAEATVDAQPCMRNTHTQTEATGCYIDCFVADSMALRTRLQKVESHLNAVQMTQQHSRC